MLNRVCSVFLKLIVPSMLVITVGAGGCSSGRGIRVGTTGGSTSSTAGATVGVTSTTGGTTGTIGNTGGGGMTSTTVGITSYAGTVGTTGGITGITGGAGGGDSTVTSGGTTGTVGGTGGITSAGGNGCTTDQNTCATDDDCTMSDYRPPISSADDCYCFECGYPVANAIAGDCQAAYVQFCGPGWNWQEEHNCPNIPCALYHSRCIGGVCEHFP
jgi:hypothetical protein